MNIERALQRPLWPVHRALFRLTKGRFGTREPSANRVGTLMLTTRGRSTGRDRTTGVFFIRDGTRFVIVASNSGDERDPNWYLNLRAQPRATISLDGKTIPVAARDASAEERERLRPALVSRFSGFARYEQRTRRHIPIVILEPVA